MGPTRINANLLSWAPDIEPQALEQAERSSRLPFVHGHVALMPDAHWGMGATIGSVIPTKGAIIPAAVGVDIGCGMLATRLCDENGPLTSASLPDDLAGLHQLIAAAVPAGVGQGHQDPKDLPPAPPTAAWAHHGEGLLLNAAKQMGTLGSGNHFVEVCLDEADHVWVVLHSGSRGVGNKLATYHINEAKGLMKQWWVNLEDPDLAYLVQGTPQFDEYISDMLWAQEYAMDNRWAMYAEIMRAASDFLGRPLTGSSTVNCHHNFTQQEHHGRDNVWVTRKGAIRAFDGDKGVIPGSMGTRSYIVSGLGNTAAYCSCSHGAGRRLGRKEARRQLTAESLTEAMTGITWNSDAEGLLDEHPSAYKDIDEVMANQQDLVTIDHTLHQILNYKGT